MNDPFWKKGILACLIFSVTLVQAAEPAVLDPRSQERARQAIEQERQQRKAWEALWELYQDVPQDVSAWGPEFLRSRKPHYCLDLEAWGRDLDGQVYGSAVLLDTGAMRIYRAQYEAIRAAFLRAYTVPSRDRQRLFEKELEEMIRDAEHARARGEVVPTETLTRQYLNYVRLYRTEGSFGWLFFYQAVPPRDFERIFAVFRASGEPRLQELAQGRGRLIDLYQTPFEWRTTDLEGRSLDLRDYRGKVVLIHLFTAG